MISLRKPAEARSGYVVTRGKRPLSWASAVAFRRYFWQPPRAHGDVIEGREVSVLELFYDLVYVVVISQAARHLSGQVTWAGVGKFAVVFGLIWLAWINGAVYHDLHGRAEGRTRSYVFLQMGVLALLAVFTAGATAGEGPAFAVVYSAVALGGGGRGRAPPLLACPAAVAADPAADAGARRCVAAWHPHLVLLHPGASSGSVGTNTSSWKRVRATCPASNVGASPAGRKGLKRCP